MTLQILQKCVKAHQKWAKVFWSGIKDSALDQQPNVFNESKITSKMWWSLVLIENGRKVFHYSLCMLCRSSHKVKDEGAREVQNGKRKNQMRAVNPRAASYISVAIFSKSTTVPKKWTNSAAIMLKRVMVEEAWRRSFQQKREPNYCNCNEDGSMTSLVRWWRARIYICNALLGGFFSNCESDSCFESLVISPYQKGIHIFVYVSWHNRALGTHFFFSPICLCEMNGGVVKIII